MFTHGIIDKLFCLVGPIHCYPCIYRNMYVSGNIRVVTEARVSFQVAILKVKNPAVAYFRSQIKH